MRPFVSQTWFFQYSISFQFPFWRFSIFKVACCAQFLSTLIFHSSWSRASFSMRSFHFAIFLLVCFPQQLSSYFFLTYIFLFLPIQALHIFIEFREPQHSSFAWQDSLGFFSCLVIQMRTWMWEAIFLLKPYGFVGAPKYVYLPAHQGLEHLPSEFRANLHPTTD